LRFSRFAETRRPQPKKKPCVGAALGAETERRARFSYDGLLQLFSFCTDSSHFPNL
jgi:hypothetical protein